jgi:hypothetical protein
MKSPCLEALPPIYDRSKDMLGVIGSRPVLPCYFEVEPHGKYLELCLEKVAALLVLDLDRQCVDSVNNKQLRCRPS